MPGLFGQIFLGLNLTFVIVKEGKGNEGGQRPHICQKQQKKPGRKAFAILLGVAVYDCNGEAWHMMN